MASERLRHDPDGGVQRKPCQGVRPKPFPSPRRIDCEAPDEEVCFEGHPGTYYTYMAFGNETNDIYVSPLLRR